MEEEVYRHWTRRFLFTVGVKCIADQHSCWWLVDLASSYVGDKRLIGEEFQVWQLHADTATRTGTVTVDDGNGRVLLNIGLEYCDYPEASLKLYLVGPDLVLMTPDEY